MTRYTFIQDDDDIRFNPSVLFPMTPNEMAAKISDLEAENKRLRQLAEFMVQRALQIETECLKSGDVATNLVYGYAVRQIEAYENEIGEAVRDEKSV